MTADINALPAGAGSVGAVLLGSAATLALLAVVVNIEAQRLEAKNPPIGRFIDVNGVRLHYTERGQGRPVVLLHGNQSMMQDFLLSIADPLAERHRVILFDRPGFGYSERPKDRTWHPEDQMEVIRAAVHKMGIERPLIVGHSFATLIALAWAIRYPEEIAGIVVESGYYFPYTRPDSWLASLNALPLIGPVNRNTISPVVQWLLGKQTVAFLFAPNPIPGYYDRFPAGLVLRPVTMRAAGEDGMVMPGAAERLSPQYGSIKVPVTILGGERDQLVDTRAQAGGLHDAIPGSAIRLWPETGHMAHHIHPAATVAAIEETWGRAA